MRRCVVLLVLVGAALLAGGCGGDDSPARLAYGVVPDELVGTYTTTLEASDVAGNDAPELEGPDARTWTLRVGAGGGPDNKGYLAIDTESGENLEAPGLEVDGDRLHLLREECADANGGYNFYANEYRWSLDGDTLTIETVRNSCPDRVAETILTSRPWTRTD